MKLVKNIIFSILAFCITSNAFAQELSDKEIGLDVARISARLKERSVEEHYIQIEINRMRDMYKRMHIDQQNEEEYFFKKIKVDNTIKQARRISSEIPESERNALIDLYNSTGGANWTNTVSGNRPWLVNDSNTPISGNWLGVGISNGHVVSINLNSNNLNGTLPASIGDLPFLTFISLNNNVLSGNIPSQIGLLSELTWLDLSRNRLSGSLPIEFYNLTKLWNLVLHNNNLNGNISSQIGQMTSLKIFSISVNSFSGVIPNEVGLLTNMISFQLDNNQFSGNIPLNLYQMTNLSSLNLASNQLVGNISPQISQLTSLRDLFLQVNNFSGELPSGIGQLSNLAHLWLNNNQFSGTVPTSYGSLTNLLNFSIHTNMLEGNIPSGFQNNTQLILFQISDNNFSGLLPDLSNNLFLSRLMIHNNRFRFVDFINSFPILKGRISSGAFGYSPQSKIDTPITIAKSVGQQATLKMCMDDRFHSGDTYQWFKDGLAIAGATSREYTIPAVALTDAGTYTCKSYHTSDPDMSPLILEREPIILNVLNCSPFVGSIVSYDLPEGQDYTCGNRSTFAYLDFDGSTYPSLNLDWTFLSPTGQILGTHSANSVADDSATFNFTIPGNNTIQLVVTEPNGCKTTLTNSILVNGCTTPCEEEIHFNFNFKVPFVNKGGILNNSERENIANGIGDFVNNNLQENIIFTTYDDHSSGVRTVAVQTNFATPVATATTNTSNETQIPGLLRFQDDFYNDTFSNVITNASNGITINPAITKKINISFFVITEDKFSDINAARVAYNELLATKANKVFFILMNEGRFRNTVNNALLTPQEFVSQVKNLNAIDFSSTNNVLTSDYVVYNRAQITDVNFRATLSAFLQSALQKVKDDLCDKNCTTNNPKSQVVNQSLIGLINYLVTQKNNGASDASLNNSNPTYNAFLNLKPYITDSTPGIYNFQFQRSAGTDVIRFSFSPNHIDDIVYKGSTWVLPNNMSVNMDLFINPEQYIIHPATNTGVMNYADFNVRHINFCPQEIVSCTKDNPRTQIVKNLFGALVTKLFSLNPSTITNGFTCPELTALSPYITDPNPAIYNYAISNGRVKFSFAQHNNQGLQDIEIETDITNLPNLGQMTDVDVSSYSSPDIQLDRVPGFFANGFGKTYIKHINFCPQEIVNCTKTNPNSVIVNKLFVKLVQKLIALKISGIPDANINGISIPELTALAPFITDANPGIYNFVSNSNLSEIRFSFSRDEREYDVLVNGWQSAFVNQNDYQIDLSNYTGSSNYLQIANNTFNGISIKLTRVRHINFCPQEIVNCTKNNPRTQIVKNLFGALLTKLFSLNPSTITDGFTCPELTALAPYISDPNPAIYGYNINNTEQTVSFSFAKHDKVFPDVKLNTSVNNLPGLGAMTDVDVSSYISSEILLDRVPAYFQNGGGKIYIKHINFCPDDIVYCTTKNPRTSRVKELFGKLITHLKGLSSVPDGYNCNELDLLSHYITDKDARIYNFVAEPLSFSFHKPVDGDTIKHDVLISNWGNTSSALISDIDVTYFADANTFTNLDDKITFSDGSKARRAEVRHINFCPDDICVNHISLVIDESGSIDVYEKAKIKRQLKWFLKQQADVNDLYQGNMYISIVGMSDSDDLTKRRTDFIIPTRINNANLSIFTNWVNAYGNRYDVAPNDGISGGSDFWKSGLDKALEFNTPERKLNMVIMITDGSQAQDPEALKTTMLKFNNRSQHFGPFDPAKPHLYVVGINNGFYVGNNQTNTGLRQNEDPNYVPTLKSSSPNSRVAPALSLSLKYLLDLPEAEFPFNDISDFEKDYFGHNDFSFIGDELNEFYFSNKIKKAGISCRKETGKDTCEDCFSFQPIPTKWYVLNAWAKEELNVQVQKYNNPKIKLHFYDINENEIFDNIQDPSDDNNYPVIFEAKGEIIEGWQRIGNKFRVPYDAVFMEIELINEGNSVPVFFDDIRIYPIKGSMKSFVYDPETFRLMSELDENNYATYYEYDNEGGLVRIKKETVKGIKTIQETRSGNVIKVE
ncbi:MAG: hypothetical protein V4670_06210 [Bacteroidota bacterium]